MADIDLYQGEGKPMQLTYTDDDTGDAIDLSGYAMSFKLRSALSGANVVEKDDSDFNKAQAASGIIGFSLTTTDTNQAPGLYFGQARAHISSVNSDITEIFTIEIHPSFHTVTAVTGLLDGKVTVTT